MKRLGSQIFRRLFLSPKPAPKSPSYSSSSDLAVSELVGPGEVSMVSRRHSISLPIDDHEASIDGFTDTSIDPFDSPQCLRRSQSVLLGFSLKRKSLSLLRLNSAKSVRFNEKNDTQWFEVQLEEEPEGSSYSRSSEESESGEDCSPSPAFGPSSEIGEVMSGSLGEEDPKKEKKTDQKDLLSPIESFSGEISPAKSTTSSNYQSAEESTPKLVYEGLDEYQASQNEFQRSFSHLINQEQGLVPKGMWFDDFSESSVEREVEASSEEFKSAQIAFERSRIVPISPDNAENADCSAIATTETVQLFSVEPSPKSDLFSARLDDLDSSLSKSILGEVVGGRLQRELDSVTQKLAMALEMNSALNRDLKQAIAEATLAKDENDAIAKEFLKEKEACTTKLLKENEALKTELSSQKALFLALKHELGYLKTEVRASEELLLLLKKKGEALSFSLKESSKKEVRLRSSLCETFGRFHRAELGTVEEVAKILVTELSEHTEETASLLEKVGSLKLEIMDQREAISMREEIISSAKAGLDVSLEETDLLREEFSQKEAEYKALIHLKSTELEALVLDAASLKKEISCAREEGARKDDLVASMGFQLLDLESDMAETVSEKVHMKHLHEKEVSKLQQIIGDLKSQLSVSESTNSDLFAELKDIGSEKKLLKEENIALGEKCASFTASLAAKELLWELLKFDLDKLQKEVADHTQACGALKNQIELLKAEVGILEALSATLSAQISSLEKDLSISVSSLEKKEEEISSLRETKKGLLEQNGRFEVLLKSQNGDLTQKSAQLAQYMDSHLVLTQHFRRLVKATFESLSPLFVDESKEEFCQLYYHFLGVEFFQKENSGLVSGVCKLLVGGTSDLVEKYLKNELMLQYEIDSRLNYYSSMLDLYTKAVEKAKLGLQESSRKSS